METKTSNMLKITKTKIVMLYSASLYNIKYIKHVLYLICVWVIFRDRVRSQWKINEQEIHKYSEMNTEDKGWRRLCCFFSVYIVTYLKTLSSVAWQWEYIFVKQYICFKLLQQLNSNKVKIKRQSFPWY